MKYPPSELILFFQDHFVSPDIEALLTETRNVQSIGNLASLELILREATPLVLVYAKPSIDWSLISKIRHHSDTHTPLGLIVLAPSYSFDEEKLAFSHLVDHYLLSASPTDSLANRVLALARKIEMQRRRDAGQSLPQSRGQKAIEISLCGQDIRLENHSAYIDGNLIQLSPIHLKLLKLFINHPGKLFTRDDLQRLVWQGQEISSRSVDAQISKLKKAIPVLKDRLVNHYGQGYSLNAIQNQKLAS